MPNTALNRTVAALLTNKSGGALVYGDVVILDNTNANGFTTTTTSGLSTRGLGVIIEPNGIANNATGLVASGGWVPKINLNTAATVGQFLKTHTVAGQATPHSSPQVEGDFAVALEASATPAAILFGTPNGPLSGGAGTVTNTGALAANALVIGNGGVDVSTTTTGTGIVTALGVNVGTAGAPVVNGGALGTPSSGTLTNCTGYPAPAGSMVQVVNTQTGAVATGTTTIPYDDTIPQNTEGTEFMTLSVTPTSATNKLRIDVVIFLSPSANFLATLAALFQDTTANALAAAGSYVETGTAWATVGFTHYMTAGTTSATTFKVRAGCDNAGTITFNGSSGSRRFGGVMASSITITEIKV